MRISELSSRTGVPVATVKYYLREGLLPAGRLTSSTQAQYDEAHVARLRLVRALLGPARLSIAQVKDVLAAVDEPAEGLFTTLGRAQHATASAEPPVDLEPARRLVERAGWDVDPDSPEIGELAAALAAIEDAGFTVPPANLERYLAGIRDIAQTEIDNVPEHSPEGAVQYAVLGTILVEPVLLALRRLAHQDAAGRRFGRPAE